MRRFWIFIVALTMQQSKASLTASGEGFYSIVAPGTLKSNRKYTVAITLHENPQPATIRVSIEGPRYNESKQVTVAPLETQELHFMPPKLHYEKYNLYAEGLNGLKFRNETSLNVDDSAGPKIYTQTDKARYKPLDLVRFRVVILDEHTRPLNISEPMRVDILDCNENRVKQFKDIVLIHGVYTDNFNLSEFPAMGPWQIVVTISGKYGYSKRKFFTVEKYKLPKFYVEIDTPKDLTPANRELQIMFFGKYTFNKYVEGNATVSLFKEEFYESHFLLKKQLAVKETAIVNIKTEDIPNYHTIEKLSLRIQLTDKFSGDTKGKTEFINIHPETYQISVNPADIEFNGRIPYRLKAYVREWNGMAVMDSKTPVHMKHGDRIYEAHLDKEGSATFEFKHEPLSDHIIKYKDSSASLPNILGDNKSQDKEKDSFCRLTLLNGSPTLGKMLEIEVTSSKDIPYIVYTIIGHANIVRMGLIKSTTKTKSQIIRLMPTIEMVPRSFVYVHYVHRGNYRYEEMTLEFPNEFENKIAVTAPHQVKPGQEVTLNIKALPKSYACILAVDLGVYLLDSSYDISRSIIFSDLLRDRTQSPVQSTKYPGIVSGTLTLTNAHYPFTVLKDILYPSGEGALGLDARKRFPETWIFQNLEISEENTKVTLNIPDTITTWRITTFSVHNDKGFGMAEDATNIVTTLPFFIDVNLPYAVKRGEIVAIPMTLFNYHNMSLEAKVTMYNGEQEFDFMDVEMSATADVRLRSKNITISPNGGQSLSFTIRPRKLGEISLNITANSNLSSDAVLHKLKVEPEGIKENDNQPLLVSIPVNEAVASTINAEIPNNIVAETEFITLSMTGDALAPILENLDGLVLMPTGCGEQNMVNFAPNVLVLLYLKAIGKYGQERELVKRAKNYIEIGYQQELSFRHTNGCYSVFGEKRDRDEGSTWLTAYVIRFFIKASAFTSIEQRIISSGLDYLAENQRPNGEFTFTGYLFYPAQQNRFGFTAFVLMTFLEDRRHSQKYKSVIEKGLNFLSENLNDINDIYALSIMAATLKMAKHKDSTKIIEKLMEKINEKDGLRWWSANDKSSEKDVEITSYVLIALLETPGNYGPIIKWLLGQRNSQGGFMSTHDTVVGLQALVKYYKSNTHKSPGIKLQYVAEDDKGITMKTDEFAIDSESNIGIQTHILPRSTRFVKFNATGSGQSLLQLSSHYYKASDEDTQHFQIKTSSERVNENTIDLDICFSYQQSDGSAFTNMVIMEVNLPSGFRTDAEFSYNLLENELIQRIQAQKDDTILVIYFDNLAANKQNCITVSADKTHDVSLRKPSAIRMYDYYNISRSNTEFYSIDD
uniref:TEP1-F n=1 Tax=Stomoxys calcitrans TaxID=35570 RepID=A0A1I8PV47_STOCA